MSENGIRDLVAMGREVGVRDGAGQCYAGKVTRGDAAGEVAEIQLADPGAVIVKAGGLAERLYDGGVVCVRGLHGVVGVTPLRRRGGAWEVDLCGVDFTPFVGPQGRVPRRVVEVSDGAGSCFKAVVVTEAEAFIPERVELSHPAATVVHAADETADQPAGPEWAPRRYRVADEIAAGRACYFDPADRLVHAPRWVEGPDDSPSGRPRVRYTAGEQMRAGQTAWASGDGRLWSSPGAARDGKAESVPTPAPAPVPESDPHCPAPPVVMPEMSAGVMMSRAEGVGADSVVTTALIWRGDDGSDLDDLGELAWRALNGPGFQDGPPDGAHAATDDDERDVAEWVKEMTDPNGH